MVKTRSRSSGRLVPSRTTTGLRPRQPSKNRYDCSASPKTSAPYRSGPRPLVNSKTKDREHRWVRRVQPATSAQSFAAGGLPSRGGRLPFRASAARLGEVLSTAQALCQGGG